MNLQNFKIRSSAAGKLMTSARSKSELLSETTKTYAKEWLTEQIYGFRKEIKSKYIYKGLVMEDEAIDKAIEWLDLPFAIKNEQYFENDFIKGTPDLIVDGVVYDIKCSWDAYTFPIFENEIPNKDYFYQLQCYMHLTGCTKAVLTYVLLNTPEEVVFETPQNYDDLDKKYRIKTFEIDYDPSVIDTLIERVKLTREYLETLI
jgi:hypothetical protein